MHNLKVELRFIRRKFLGLHALEAASQVTPREFPGGKGGARIHRSFATKGR